MAGTRVTLCKASICSVFVPVFWLFSERKAPRTLVPKYEKLRTFTARSQVLVVCALFAAGHVDGTGQITEKRTEKDSLWIQVKTSPEIIRYIVPKGFIAIDGTSLTVVDVNREENWFTFMLIEYTQKKIVVPGKPVGSLLNIEVDVLGKYSESSVAAFIPRLEALEAKMASLEQKLASLN